MKIEVIHGKDIKKQSADNNYVYLKATRQNYTRLSNLRFLDDRLGFKLADNDRQITLDLPKLLYDKTLREPAFKTLVDCMTIYGLYNWRYKFEKPKLKSAFNKATAEIADYQEEIDRLDQENETLKSQLNELKEQLAAAKEFMFNKNKDF
jgi:FtsZ-binding cell division protein ZapB